MDEVINNISNPSWWIMTTITMTVIALISKTFNYINSLIKKTFIYFSIKRKLNIKNSRWNQSLVFYQIAKSNSFFIIFIIICCMYLIWLTNGSFLLIMNQSKLAAIILSLPIYISEMVWLVSNEYTKDLVKARGKITKN